MPNHSSLVIAISTSLMACVVGLWSFAAGDSGQVETLGPSKSMKAAVVDDFYRLPSPLVPGGRGEVIRREPTDGYALPFTISAVRILYHSVSGSGRDAPASGVVLLPKPPVPAGGWPVIVWAHPFVGAAVTCAPSLMKSLYDGALLSMYVNMGYVVVAPDYVGLGTGVRNAAFDARSNAQDLIYSVRAAISAVPELSTKWLIVGVRDGGLAALIANELESRIADTGYLGSIAIDPMLNLKVDIESSSRQGLDLFPPLVYGLKTVYPDFDVDRILASSSAGEYSGVGTECSPVSRLPDSPSSASWKPGWENNPVVASFLARNALGSTHALKPMLLIASTDPPLTSMDKQAIARMCKRGDDIEVESYAVRPQELAGESVSNQIAWLRARFSGLASPPGCQ